MTFLARLFGASYGIISYLIGIGGLVAFILFANNHIAALGIQELSKFAIDIGAANGNAPLINTALILLFGVQHSVMARPGFKAILTNALPLHLERSTYVLATGLVMAAMVYWWQPMPNVVWRIEGETARLAINGVYYMGWLITFLATFMINHFHLFGLQQSMGSEPDRGAKEFVTPFFYKLVRHPIQTGIFIAMIAAPDMTMGRLMLTVGMIGYIFIGLYFEERDLIAEFGDIYRDYKKRVPGLLPVRFGAKPPVPSGKSSPEREKTPGQPAE